MLAWTSAVDADAIYQSTLLLSAYIHENISVNLRKLGFIFLIGILSILPASTMQTIFHMVHKHHLLYDLIRSPSKQGLEFSNHVAKKAFNRCQLYVRRNQHSKPKICNTNPSTMLDMDRGFWPCKMHECKD
jgi:hypothetical protein